MTLFHGKIGWLNINVARASFISKALVAFSLSVTLLAQTEFLFQIFGSAGKIKASLSGAVIFLIGYCAPFFFATPEFRVPKSKPDIILGWAIAADQRFLNSRMKMLESLLIRYEEHPPRDIPEGVVEWAKILHGQMLPSPSMLRVKLQAAQMFDAELELRAYDQFMLRVFISSLLGIGIILMGVPLLSNFLLLMIS